MGNSSSGEDSEHSMQPKQSQEITTKTKIPDKIGQIKIEKCLGEGTFGDVRYGYDINTHEEFALKFMDKNKSFYAQNEADILQNINHPNIIGLKYCLNLNIESEAPKLDKSKRKNINKRRKNKSGKKRRHRPTEVLQVLVLEYCPKGDLSDVLICNGAFSEKVARTYFHQLIDAIQYLHEKCGIIHRDIKPDNLLLDSGFVLKLCDFGTSKKFNHGMTQKMVDFNSFGTKGYRAPEAEKLIPYDESVDIFSCGVVLFIMLSAAPPFDDAVYEDQWFDMFQNDKSRYWELQKDYCPIFKKVFIRHLINGMCTDKVNKRFSIGDIQRHSWYNKPILNRYQLVNAMRQHVKTKINKEFFMR